MQKIIRILNIKHELILTRSRDDLNAVLQNQITINDKQGYETFKIELTRIEWLIPYVVLSDKRKIQLFNYIQKDIAIPMSFQS